MRKTAGFIVLFAILVGVMVTPTSAANDFGASLYYNNASNVNSAFSIENGEALIDVVYVGYEGIFTEAHVYVKLEKRNLLVFWKDVTEWETVSYNSTDSIEFTYPVDSGKYRATIRVEIFGRNGTSDVVENELKADC